MKKTSLSIAAAAAVLLANGAGFASDLPTYEQAGLPISPVQVQVLGGSHVEQQAPVPTSTVTPLQLSVLTPRTKLTAVKPAPLRVQTVGSIR